MYEGQLNQTVLYLVSVVTEFAAPDALLTELNRDCSPVIVYNAKYVTPA